MSHIRFVIGFVSVAFASFAHAEQASPDVGGSVPPPGSATVLTQPLGICWNRELTSCSKVPAGSVVRIVEYQGELIIVRVIFQDGRSRRGYLR